MRTKQQIIDAIELAIADHKAFAQEHAGSGDHEFVACLRDAMTIVADAPEVAIPAALTKEH